MEEDSKKEKIKDLDNTEKTEKVEKPTSSKKADSKKSKKKIIKPMKAKEIVIDDKKKLISFDAFFAIMRSKDSKILNHHKGPMIAFLKGKGFKKLMATREQFEDAFKDY